MSIADTAEYQLECLANTLTKLSEAITGTPSHIAAYQDALGDVAAEMGITETKAFKYP